MKHATLLYGRAATEGRFRGRTRADFDNLHHSMHEFRVVDRSDEQSQELSAAARPPEPVVEVVGSGGAGGSGDFGFDEQAQALDTNTLLNQLMAEVSSNVDEQGAWSQWWPPMEEVELPPTDGNMSMLL